jgi:AcrR family transcriptional regulator
MCPRRTNAERSATTRAHVIAAARAQFATQGWAGTSMAQVADAAGVSTGALYHHWGTKTELLGAVVSDMHREIAAEVIRTVSASEPPLQRLDTAAGVFLRRCEDHDVARILLVDGPAVLGERWDELDRRWWLTPTEELLREAVSAGDLVTENPRLLAAALLGSLTALGRHTANAGAPGHRAALRAFRGLTSGLTAYAERPGGG